jgi:hypothetical protein
MEAIIDVNLFQKKKAINFPKWLYYTHIYLIRCNDQSPSNEPALRQYHLKVLPTRWLIGKCYREPSLRICFGLEQQWKVFFPLSSIAVRSMKGLSDLSCFVSGGVVWVATRADFGVLCQAVLRES